MGRYLIRRILQFIPVFFGATLIVFMMVFLIPGDPIRALAGERPMAPAVLAQLTDEYDLDDPAMVRYAKWLGVMPDDDPNESALTEEQMAEGVEPPTGTFNGLLQGNFGDNFRGQPVSDILGRTIPTTATLAIYAFIFEAVLGLIAGVFAGLNKDSFLDNLVRISTIMVISIPIFVIGFGVQILIIVFLQSNPPEWLLSLSDGWLNISWRDPDTAIFTLTSIKAYFIPAVVLGSVSLAYIARLTRTSMIENTRADFVRTARAKGLTRARTVVRHLLRNSLIPVVTFLGIDLGNLMGGAIVTESIFNVNGLGQEVLAGVRGQEGTVVLGIITFLILIFLIANLIVDVLYAYLDPRIRYD
ncbi:MAG: ABC transporter permease subunit [Acidimicrobiia bacterium]|nr:ABC transporter permease subunit [Acidimicrobiia bacterium]